MTPNESGNTTRVCEWCAEAIHEKALKCPRCQNIDRDRRHYLVGLTGWGVTLLLLVIVFGRV
jgi:hypothetical protein